MKHFTTSERVFQALRSTCVALCIALATLAAIEIVLRIVDLRILREDASERSLTYAYDAELGWAPVPGSSALVTTCCRLSAQAIASRLSTFASGPVLSCSISAR